LPILHDPPPDYHGRRISCWGKGQSDLEDLRKVDDTLEKAVIIGIWAVTIVIAVLVINFAVGFVGTIVSAIRELL
jgi:hypothetical protein